MSKNILLMGMMGSGKSSIGIRLSRRLKRKFIDTDREIEKITGLSIQEIFKQQGEIRFRSEEKLMLEKILKDDNQIIASGGTLELTQDLKEFIDNRAVLIYLKASVKEIFQRVNRKKGTRPLLKRISTIDEMASFIDQRDENIDLAEFHIITDSKSLDQIVEEIVLKLEKSKNL